MVVFQWNLVGRYKKIELESIKAIRRSENSWWLMMECATEGRPW